MPAASSSRPANRTADFWKTYTRDLTREDVERLVTRETREAWRYFTQGLDQQAMRGLPWHRRLSENVRAAFEAFTLKLSPARRLLYGVSLLATLVGLLQLFRGFEFMWVPAGVFSLPMFVPTWTGGTLLLVLGFALVNALVLLEVADRLSLKNDLEIAREIQQAMLPHDTYRAGGVEVHGQTRPANTVGGDFYDIQPQQDGRLLIALGDVAGKGSPAALLMALLLAMLRTLLDEGLPLPALMDRLNTQIWRHAPRSRFITLFLGLFDPASGRLAFVNAGQNPPLLRRADGSFQFLSTGGIALGLRDGSSYLAADEILAPGDTVVLYSDGITEAEGPDEVPFDEQGVQRVLDAWPDATAPDLGAALMRAVAHHARDTRFADDLTVVVLRRTPPLPLV